MASVPSRAASAQRNFFAGSLTRPAKGASKGRTSGQLFSAASRVHLSRPTRLGSPGYGLSSAPTRDKCTRDGAELAGCKSPTAAALSPLLEAKLASGATLGGSAGRPCSVGLAVASIYPQSRIELVFSELKWQLPCSST